MYIRGVCYEASLSGTGNNGNERGIAAGFYCAGDADIV